MNKLTKIILLISVLIFSYFTVFQLTKWKQTEIITFFENTDHQVFVLVYKKNITILFENSGSYTISIPEFDVLEKVFIPKGYGGKIPIRIPDNVEKIEIEIKYNGQEDDTKETFKA